jgi:uncharacterized membrane protein
MFENLKKFAIINRHNLAVFFLLNFGCLICVALVLARIAYSDNTRHTGLIWNLFLAWIPFILAYFAHAISWKRSWVYMAVAVIAFLWLIFFPNAPYMLTDLQDLARTNRGAPLWYDVIIVGWCSWTGMMLGVISLYLMQDIITRTFGRKTGWVFVFVISGLSSFGIYIGRFVRLNSWDILQNPGETAMDILGLVIDPSMRLAAFTILYTFFFLFIFLLLYSFSHMLTEQSARSQALLDRFSITQPSDSQQ